MKTKLYTRYGTQARQQWLRKAIITAVAVALLPIAGSVQTSFAQAKSSSVGSDAKSDAKSDTKSDTKDKTKNRKTRITVVSQNGQATTRVFSDSADVDIDVSRFVDSIRSQVRDVLKDAGKISVESDDGSMSFSFKHDGKDGKEFSIHIDSAMRSWGKVFGKSFKGMGGLHLERFRDWNNWGEWGAPMPPMPPRESRLPRVPRPPRAPHHGGAWYWNSDDHEFTSEGAKRLEAEAEAMNAEADAMRKEAEAIRKEAAATLKRAEALRLEAKAKKATESADAKSKTEQSEKKRSDKK